MKTFLLIAALLMPLLASGQVVGGGVGIYRSKGNGNGSGSGSITNLSPAAGSIYAGTAFSVLAVTNTVKLFTNYTASAVSNVIADVSGTNGYLRVTNAGLYYVDFAATYRSITNGAIRTNVIVVTTNVAAVGLTETLVKATSISQGASNIYHAAAGGWIYMPSNTYVALGVKHNDTSTTNDLSILNAVLSVSVAGGTTYGSGSGGSGSGIPTSAGYGTNTTLLNARLGTGSAGTNTGIRYGETLSSLSWSYIQVASGSNAAVGAFVALGEDNTWTSLILEQGDSQTDGFPFLIKDSAIDIARFLNVSNNVTIESNLLVRGSSVFSGPATFSAVVTNNDRVWLNERINQAGDQGATLGPVRTDRLFATNTIQGSFATLAGVVPFSAPLIGAASSVGNMYATNQTWKVILTSNTTVAVAQTLTNDMRYSLTLSNSTYVVSWNTGWKWLDGSTKTDAPLCQDGEYVLEIWVDSVSGNTNAAVRIAPLPVFATYTGTGGANTNFTIFAGTQDAYINGFTNVSIRAVMQYLAGTPKYWNLTITNGSGSDRTLEFSSVTNRYRFAGTYGTNAPSVLTNATQLLVSGRSDGTNTTVGYQYFAWP
jgi:hypothetical protein